ncbi:hypothetical protein GFS60_04661 [Rhodococcus sp. WAY2]|nr:hypothetical protein GFS60_04661 [Rhodococcus sp. WAY2]
MRRPELMQPSKVRDAAGFRGPGSEWLCAAALPPLVEAWDGDGHETPERPTIHGR